MEISLRIARNSGRNSHSGATFVIREIEIRESLHDSRGKDVTFSIFFALVFFRRHDAIVNCIGMKHYRDEVKEKETDPESCGGDGGQKHENPDGNRTSHPQKTCQSVTLVNMPQTGDHT